MNKIVIEKLDECVYQETLENGLNVLIYKKEGYNEKGAFFVTKYGSATNDFIPINEKEYVSFPKGIAHFLEHKLFESEEQEKIFDIYNKYGADVNAYTNHDITNYYFSCINNFDECLITLLDFVQTPYFTDENVEKEKGIINEEINMTNDDIDRFMYEELYNVSLCVNENKYKTIGDKENVNKITKEDLYRCYNTFYNPSNMVLAIYGDIDIENTLRIIKDNQRKKKFGKLEKIDIKEKEEPEKVYCEYKEYNKKVAVPKVGVCYKIKVDSKFDINRYKYHLFINMMLESKFGGTSSFEKDLLKKKIIEDSIDYSFSSFDDVILIFIETATNKKDEYLKILDKHIKENKFDEKIFELNKRSFLSFFIKAFETPGAACTIMFNHYLKYNMVINNIYEICNSYTYKKFIKDYQRLNLNNKSVIYIKNK